MYPFKNDHVFVRNAWYIAAWSSEVTEALMARMILDESIVFYRTTNGRPVALADMCPHRGFPLSKGLLIGNQIQCGYHGLEYDDRGICVRIPSQERIPAGFRVRAYPLAERWNWIWIWMGQPEKADESLIPDHPGIGLDNPDWLAFEGAYLLVKSRAQIIHDNLLDLSHVSFLHEGLIGTPDVAEAKAETTVDGQVVRVSRTTRDEEPTPYYAKRYAIQGRLDREQTAQFFAPALHVTHVRVMSPGSDRQNGSAKIYGENKTINAITPATKTMTHVFWAISRTYGKTEETTELVRSNTIKIFEQDVFAFESIEAMIERQGISELSCIADEGAIKGRRLIQAMLDAEPDASVRPPQFTR